MRAYLIDPIARTVSEVDIDGTADHRGYSSVCKLLGAKDAHLMSTWLNPKADEDIEGGDDHLGDYCYSGTFFGDIFPAKSIDAARLEVLLAQCRAKIPGDPKCWFQIDADRSAPATFPVSTRAIVVGLNCDGEWCDLEMSLDELKSRVTFTRGGLRRMTLRDDLEQGTTWVGPVVLSVEGAVQ